MSGRLFLLIEDDAAIHALADEALTAEGYAVAAVAEGDAGGRGLDLVPLPCWGDARLARPSRRHRRGVRPRLARSCVGRGCDAP